MEYIDSRIKLIKNSAKLKLASIKEDFNIDDEEILNQILSEYEQYEQNKEKSEQNESQDSHKKFVDEYRVSEEDLLPVVPKSEKESNAIEKEYEDLPGDVII